jgi:hypothetical protein
MLFLPNGQMPAEIKAIGTAQAQAAGSPTGRLFVVAMVALARIEVPPFVGRMDTSVPAPR